MKNTIHILYPIQPLTQNFIINNHNINNWQRIYYIEDNPVNETKQSSTLFNFFLPSLKTSLFSEQSLLKIYRRRDLDYTLQFRDKTEASSHLIVEEILLFVFNNEYAFLDVKLSLSKVEIMIDNTFHSVTGDELDKLQDVYPETFSSYNFMINLLDCLKINHKKYESQDMLSLTNPSIERTWPDISDLFCYLVNKLFPDQLIISSSNNSFNVKGLSKYKYYENVSNFIEPDSFIHAYFETNEKLTNQILFNSLQFGESSFKKPNEVSCHPFDDVEMLSKGFIDNYVRQHLYARWAHLNTFYLCNENLSLGISSKGSPAFIQDTFNQQYLILIVLQLYYREELQKIMGTYSSIKNLSVAQVKANTIAQNFYTLNQNFYFPQITNELQGSEIWEFYNQNLNVKKIFEAVRQDMNELNQKLIELGGSSQNKVIHELTILSVCTGWLGMNVLITGKKEQFLEIINSLSFANHLEWLPFLYVLFRGFTYVIAFYLFGFILYNFFKPMLIGLKKLLISLVTLITRFHPKRLTTFFKLVGSFMKKQLYASTRFWSKS